MRAYGILMPALPGLTGRAAVESAQVDRREVNGNVDTVASNGSGLK